MISLGSGEAPIPTPKLSWCPRSLCHSIDVTSSHTSPLHKAGMDGGWGSSQRSRGCIYPADSSPLSWQGQEGQIGPVGLNSSEGPKVSASVSCGPWFSWAVFILGCRTRMRPPCPSAPSWVPPSRAQHHDPASCHPPPHALHPCTHSSHALTCQGGWMDPFGAYRGGDAGGRLEHCLK